MNPRILLQPVIASSARKWMAIGMLACLGIQGCAGGIVHNDIQTARRYADQGKQLEGIAILRPLADAGDRVAQYELAQMYATTGRYRKDLEQAMKWLLKSAEQGYTKAQFELGFHYAVDYKNYADATKWYKLAAQNLDDKEGLVAAANLGVIYAQGQGTPPDLAEAARWYHLAADKDDARSQHVLGGMYLDGRGVPQDFNQAIAWFSKAAAQGHTPARYVLGFIFAEGFETKPDPLQAAYWMSGTRPANEGEAAYRIGLFYAQGFFANDSEMPVIGWRLRRLGVGEKEADEELRAIYGQRWQDLDQAVYWYTKGAEAGFVGAQVNLARVLWSPNSKHWNCAAAIKWTQAAATQGDVTAFVNTGLYYQQGPDRQITMIGVQVVRKDNAIVIADVKAGSAAERAGIQTNDVVETLNRESVAKMDVKDVVEKMRASDDKPITLGIRRGGAAIKPITVAATPTPLKCPGGEGLKRDPAEAVRWFQKAADAGDLTGLFLLASAYREGNGVAQDYAKAKKLYEEGADRDDWESAQAISHMYSAGEGVEKSESAANEWMRKAIRLKHQAIGRR